MNRNGNYLAHFRFVVYGDCNCYGDCMVTVVPVVTAHRVRRRLQIFRLTYLLVETFRSFEI